MEPKGDANMRRQSLAVIVVLCLLGPVALRADDSKPAESRAPRRIPGIVFIPTPHDVVEQMLQLAKVGRDDTVYDLGCGDGRIVIAAARKHGCQAIGLDIDPRRVEEASKNVERSRLAKLVEIRTQDLFTADLRKATVVMLYLTSAANVKLIPHFNKMKPGSRIVSHQFDIKGVKPDRILQVRSKEDGRSHTLYLWITPLQVVASSPPRHANESPVP
jgi:SAM-dependent methyltransferase